MAFMEPSHSFQCPSCSSHLVVSSSSSDSISGPCPICRETIEFSIKVDSSARAQFLSKAAGDAPVLLPSRKRRFRRSKVSSSRRSALSWFKKDLADEAGLGADVPVLIQRRRSLAEEAFVPPSRLADRLSQLAK